MPKSDRASSGATVVAEAPLRLTRAGIKTMACPSSALLNAGTEPELTAHLAQITDTEAQTAARLEVVLGLISGDETDEEVLQPLRQERDDATWAAGRFPEWRAQTELALAAARERRELAEDEQHAATIAEDVAVLAAEAPRILADFDSLALKVATFNSCVRRTALVTSQMHDERRAPEVDHPAGLEGEALTAYLAMLRFVRGKNHAIDDPRDPSLPLWHSTDRPFAAGTAADDDFKEALRAAEEARRYAEERLRKRREGNRSLSPEEQPGYRERLERNGPIRYINLGEPTPIVGGSFSATGEKKTG